MRTAIIIPANLSQPVRTEQVGGLEDLQRLVGGWIEVLPLDREDIAAYGNEEAKLEGLANNRRASEWWQNNVTGTITGDYLAGDVVITGFDPESGNDTDVPADLIATFDL